MGRSLILASTSHVEFLLLWPRHLASASRFPLGKAHITGAGSMYRRWFWERRRERFGSQAAAPQLFLPCAQHFGLASHNLRDTL